MPPGISDSAESVFRQKIPCSVGRVRPRICAKLLRMANHTLLQYWQQIEETNVQLGTLYEQQQKNIQNFRQMFGNVSNFSASAGNVTPISRGRRGIVSNTVTTTR